MTALPFWKNPLTDLKAHENSAMKTQLAPTLVQRAALLLLFTLNPQLSSCFAQGTAFTYQGQLAVSGANYTGSAEFQATLWAVPSGGTALATNSPPSLIVGVSNGLFVLPLDFGASFPGADRWLQLEVRTAIGPFTLLSPRQKLTAAPYAITSRNLTGTLPAAQLSGTLPSAQLSGTYSSAVTLNNSANSFSGSGAGLTSLNASQLASGTVPDAQLAPTVARTNQVWLLAGNAGTTAGTNFLGTTDNQSLELKVNNQRVLRLEPGNSGIAPNLVGGHRANVASNAFFQSTARGVFIGGGGSSSGPNVVLDDFAIIVGGTANTNNGDHSFLGGGSRNYIEDRNNALVGGLRNSLDGRQCFIGGGEYNVIESISIGAVLAGGTSNEITADFATISGGLNNLIESGSDFGTISGGASNRITFSSPFSTIPGGYSNFVNADFAFAAGRRARAVHNGAFVWADSEDASFSSTAANQFLVRAAGGVGVNVAQPRGELHVGNSSNAAPISAANQTIIVEHAAENGRAAFLALAGPGASSSTNRVELEFEASEAERRAIIGTTSNHEVQFRQNNTARMVINTGGNVAIGITAGSSDASLHVQNTSGAPRPIKCDRVGSDGQLIAWARDDTLVGDVSVAGGIVSYNAFTGSHYAWLPQRLERGTLVTMTGENRQSGEEREIIYGVAATIRANDPACLGAYLAPHSTSESSADTDRHQIMAVGNGELWVTDGSAGDIRPGDFLIASGVAGCAMKDDPDRFPVGYICARAAEAVQWADVQAGANGIKRVRVSVLFENFVRDSRGAAVQGLNQRLTEELKRRDAENTELKQRLAKLEERLDERIKRRAP
jgi:hypothetical protein